MRGSLPSTFTSTWRSVTASAGYSWSKAYLRNGRHIRKATPRGGEPAYAAWYGDTGNDGAQTKSCQC